MSVKTIDEGLREQKAKALLKLVKKNPTLPIIPLVDAEIVGDDCGRWMGAFGTSCVGEIAAYDDRYFTDRDDFKDIYYDLNDEELCEKFNFDPGINNYTMDQGKCTEAEVKVNAENEKKLDEYLDKIANKYFSKAIIVYIDLLD